MTESRSSAQLVDIRLRRAVATDAAALSAVFDAAVRDAWTYLGELEQRPMFSGDHWEQLIADFAHQQLAAHCANQSARAGLYVVTGSRPARGRCQAAAGAA